MKILIVSPDKAESGSGIASAVRFQRKSLEKMGHETYLLCRGSGTVYSHFSKNLGILDTIPFWERAIRQISTSEREYDLIWLHSPLLFRDGWLRNQKVARIITFHSTYFGQYEAFKCHGLAKLLPYYIIARGLERSFLERITKKTSFHNTKFVAVSPNVHEELIKNGLKRKINVIPNVEGSVPKFRISKTDARRTLRETYSLGVSDDNLVLLYVGRLTEVKQPYLLVNAFNKIAKSNDSLHLILVGSGNLKKKLQARAEFRDCHTIHFMGNVAHEDLENFYFGADAYISLSCYEGNPISVLEATTHKLPLILSDIPAHRWIFESKVGAGIIVNSKNPEVTKIVKFLNKADLGKQYPLKDAISRKISCCRRLKTTQKLIS